MDATGSEGSQDFIPGWGGRRGKFPSLFYILILKKGGKNVSAHFVPDALEKVYIFLFYLNKSITTINFSD